MPWNPEHYSVKTKEVMKILEDNKITNVGKNTPYSKDKMTKKILCKECCKGFLVEKEGKYGYFYGCSNFPECKHTESWTLNDKTRVDTWWMSKFLFDLYCTEEKLDESKEQTENHLDDFNLFLCELLRDLINKKKFVSEIVHKIIETKGDKYEHTK